MCSDEKNIAIAISTRLNRDSDHFVHVDGIHKFYSLDIGVSQGQGHTSASQYLSDRDLRPPGTAARCVSSGPVLSCNGWFVNCRS